MDRTSHIPQQLRRLPFQVPERYFDQLSGQVWLRVEAQKAEPYQVPEGYFDQMAMDILARVKAEPQAPQLPFSTPPGYFTQLEGDILNRVADEGAGATLVRVDWRKWAQWRPLQLAASVLVLVAAGLAFYSSNNTSLTNQHGTQVAEAMLQGTSQAEVAAYLETHGQLSEQELADLVAANPARDTIVNYLEAQSLPLAMADADDYGIY